MASLLSGTRPWVALGTVCLFGMTPRFCWADDAHATEQTQHSVPPKTIAEIESPLPVGVYVSTEWRVMNLAGGFGHGPGFAGGVTTFDGLLRFGIVGFARPGPWNPTTWSAPTFDGSEYRGSSVLSLRSDGAFIGAQVALTFDMPGLPWLRVSVPINVGQAAFGFYLSGEDRVTPDGRLVSEWEDELMDGRDSGVGLGIEGGLQLGLNIPQVSWVQPYVGMTYFSAIGFDSYVSSNYSGLTGSLGLTFGYGL